MCFLVREEGCEGPSVVFTGDALFVGGCGRWVVVCTGTVEGRQAGQVAGTKGGGQGGHCAGAGSSRHGQLTCGSCGSSNGGPSLFLVTPSASYNQALLATSLAPPHTFSHARCRRFSGTPVQMYDSLVRVLGRLPPDTLVYCGHEYTVANLEFAATVGEPGRGSQGWREAALQQVQPGKAAALEPGLGLVLFPWPVACFLCKKPVSVART